MTQKQTSLGPIRVLELDPTIIFSGFLCGGTLLSLRHWVRLVILFIFDWPLHYPLHPDKWFPDGFGPRIVVITLFFS